MKDADILTEKKRLRAQYLARRAAISADRKLQLDAALCQRIATHKAFLHADMLLCFSPVRDEPDLTALFRLARERGVKTAFPRCTGTQMTFHTVQGEHELETGRFGIPTPPKSAPLATYSKRTLCLVPALAAAKNGMRLGYGGGFYDRFLSQFPGISLLAISGDFICDSLPVEPTDRAVDHILTEKGELLQDV